MAAVNTFRTRSRAAAVSVVAAAPRRRRSSLGRDGAVGLLRTCIAQRCGLLAPDRGLLPGDRIPALDGRREPRVRAARAGGARGAARLAGEPGPSRQRRLDALSRCGHRRGLRAKRRPASSTASRRRSSPWTSAPAVASARASTSPTRSSPTATLPTHPESHPLPHPGGEDSFHPPPAASVTPKITPRGAEIARKGKCDTAPVSADPASTVVELWPA